VGGDNLSEAGRLFCFGNKGRLVRGAVFWQNEAI